MSISYPDDFQRDGILRVTKVVNEHPLWFLLIVVAAPTGFLFHRHRQKLRGHCQECGYNLTGNTSGICPECGTPIPDDLKQKLANKEPEPTTDNPKQ